MMVRIAAAAGLVICLACASRAGAQSLFDPTLRVQTYASGFDSPTGAVFLNDQGDLLVTQKNDGRVIIVRDRQIAGTALDLPVNSESERGLLSIALSPNFASDSLVYLYHTAAATDGGSPISNKVSRYRLVGNELVFDRKIIDLPPGPGPNHDGGKILFDAKGKLYVTIGDLNRRERTQNDNTSQSITASGAILRLTRNGGPIPTNPFAASGGGQRPLADIYAYGIRNSFGIAFDPVTGDLWDTENGPDRFDEINRVRPGFNSGWRAVMGPIEQNPFEPGSFVDLGPASHYSDPELSWVDPVAPTDLHFYDGPKLGGAYHNDLFVGDVRTGSLYHLDLTSARRSLRLTGPLGDYIVNNEGDLLDETENIVLGEGFGIITDILTGPGGLYVLSLTEGRLYRITQRPPELAALTDMSFVPVPEPGAAAVVMLAPAMLRRRRQRV
jgi:glucose/arabinose dehydrogenase